MSHCIEKRDFVYGLEGQGHDWHGLTVEKPGPLTKELFPKFREVGLQTAEGLVIPWRVLVTDDDGQVCGNPFTDSFGYILPGRAWDMVGEALNGTKYTVERVGMLKDRSLWFVSVSLEELKDIARKGEAFRLNFSGGLDGGTSPQGELSHIRVVCWNTLSASRSQGEHLFKVRQTKNSGDKLEEAKKEVEKAVGMATLVNKALTQLEETPCNVDAARYAYAGEVAAHGADFKITFTKAGDKRENRARNTVDAMIGLFNTGQGNRGETKADLLNGFTEYLTHGRKDSKKNIWNTVVSSEFGGNADRKASFFDAVCDDNKFTDLVTAGKEAWLNV